MADIFISYKREEKAKAEKLRNVLEAFGYSVWFDVELLSGDEFRSVIREMIDKCSAVVVLWSKLAVGSQFVVDEASYANRNNKLCPAMLEPCDLPFGFGGTHTDDLEGWEGQLRHEGFDRLLKSIEAHVGRPATPGASTPESTAEKAEIADFQAAAKIRSIASWTTFLNDYPGTPFRRFIEGQIDELNRADLPTRTTPSREPIPPKKANIMGLSVGLVVLVLTVGSAAYFIGNSNTNSLNVNETEQAFWDYAETQGNIAGYDTYLDQFPDGSYATLAKKKRNDLNANTARIAKEANKTSAWTQAKKANSIPGYEAFIEAWQDSEEAELARKAIIELLATQDKAAWEQANATNTISAYEAYLKNQSVGAYREAAVTAKIEIETRNAESQNADKADRSAWGIADRNNTIVGFESYLNDQPNGRYRNIAETRMKALKEEEAAVRTKKAIADKLAVANQSYLDWEKSTEGNSLCDESFVLYFAWGSDSLTSIGKKVVARALNNFHASNCNMRGVLVAGHSDSSGDSLTAFATGEQRAKASQAWLVSLGVPQSNITVLSFGEKKLAKQTGDGVREPLNRRVEVFIRGTKPEVPSETSPKPTLNQLWNAIPEDEWVSSHSKDLLSQVLMSISIDELETVANSGDARAARLIGFAYFDHEEREQNYSKSRRFWTLACDGGEAMGCTNLGFLYEKGQGGAQNYSQAKKLYEQACEKGEALGCTYLGQLYENGRSVTQNYAEARRLYEKACKKGKALGCSFLGYLYHNGLGVTQNYSESRKYYKQACNSREAMGCGVYGAFLYGGVGGPKNVSEGTKHLREACRDGDNWACNQLGTLGVSR